MLAESRLVDKLEGAEFRDLGPGHPRHGAVEGVLAARVESGSPAARNGLRQGDIVVAVNRTEVSTVYEFAEAVRASKPALALSVLRDGMRLFIVIQWAARTALIPLAALGERTPRPERMPVDRT